MTGRTRRGSAASSPGNDEAPVAGCPEFPTGAPGLWKMVNPVREYDWGSTGALAAWQGRESDVGEVIKVSMEEVVDRGEGIALTAIRSEERRVGKECRL